jgi:hypothetical protein
MTYPHLLSRNIPALAKILAAPFNIARKWPGKVRVSVPQTFTQTVLVILPLRYWPTTCSFWIRRRLQLRSPNAMAYIPKLETGEKLIRQFRVKLSTKAKAKPFLFAVSDRALYWPQQKLFTWNDPTYFRRIPHNQVQAVSLKKLAPYVFWLFSLIMILAGLVILMLLLAPFFELVTGIHLGLLEHVRTIHDLRHLLLILAVAPIFGGIYLSSIANRRFGLRIQTSDKSFTWKPPLLFDKPARIHVATALKDMLDSCQQAGLRILDEHQR